MQNHYFGKTSSMIVCNQKLNKRFEWGSSCLLVIIRPKPNLDNYNCLPKNHSLKILGYTLKKLQLEVFMSQCEGASLFRVYNTFSQKWHLHGQDNSTYLSEIIKNSTYHGSTLKCHQITQLIKHWMYPYTMHFNYLSSKNVNFWFLNKGPWYLPFSSMCSLSS